MSGNRFGRLVAVIVVLVAIGYLLRSCNQRDEFPPDHIGILEFSIGGWTDCAGEQLEDWGCVPPGKPLTVGFLQNGDLKAQVPTFDGSIVRVELPRGLYDIRVVEPKGRYVDQACTNIGGGARHRTDLTLVDKRSWERLRDRQANC